MKFDFASVLKSFPLPSSLEKLVVSDWTLQMRHKPSGRIFTIEHTGVNEFTLYERSAIDGLYKENDPKGNFVMRTDLRKILILLGFVKK